METISFASAFALCVILTYSAFIAKYNAVFQQCGYRIEEYVACFKSSLIRETRKVAFCSLCLFVFSFATLAIGVTWIISAVNLAFFAFLCMLFARYENIRVKAKYTFRFSRITIVGFAFYGGVCVAVACGIYYGGWVLCAAFPCVAAASLLIPFTPIVGKTINLPYDKYRYAVSIKAAREKIASVKGLKVIAVTGSCGKTTVKNYIADLLAEKYITAKTPASYNTPLGVALAAKELTSDTRFFIVEMGARRKGDIAELCALAPPDVAVITGVTLQHAETFGTLSDITEEKGKVVAALKQNGFAVISGETSGSRRIYDDCDCDKILVGAGEICDAVIKDIAFSSHGSSFSLVFGNETLKINAPFYGRHNVVDFSIAAVTALKLGVDARSIEEKANSIRPPDHRFSVFVTPAGVTIIDDGYNANIEGIKSGAESLKYFGGRKFAVFSGIAECGKEGGHLNAEAGRTLWKNCDELIAVGRYADDILRLAKGRKVATLDDAREILKNEVSKGDTVAFFSDLPDRY